MADTKTASLTVLGGPLAGTQCLLPQEGTLTIGSSPGSSLYLDLPAVSPFHARVVAEAGSIIVYDTGSSRPVHVNDNPIGFEGTELRNGDILWLGSPGDEDVVMLQCILPKRLAAAAPSLAIPPVIAPPVSAPPVTPPPFTASGPLPVPTPEIETTALWAQDTVADGRALETDAEAAVHEALAAAAAAAAAEDEQTGSALPGEPTIVGSEQETIAVAPEAEAVGVAPEEAGLAVAEPVGVGAEAGGAEVMAEAAGVAPDEPVGIAAVDEGVGVVAHEPVGGGRDEQPIGFAPEDDGVSAVFDESATQAAQASWEETRAGATDAGEAPSHVGGAEESAREYAAEPPATFIEAEEPVAQVVDDVAEPAPTLLMGAADEVIEAVDEGYRETVAFDHAPAFVEETFVPESTPEIVESAIVEEAETIAAPSPAAAPLPTPAPAAPAAPAAPMSRPAAWQTTTPPAASSARPTPTASQRTSPSASQRISPSASQRIASQRSRPKPAPRAAEAGAEHAVAPEATGAAASSSRPMLLAVGGFVGVLALVGGGYFAWRTLSARSTAPSPQPTPVAVVSAPTSEPAPLPTPTPEALVEPTPLQPTPEPVAAATPTPAPITVAQAVPTPTPRATPTPRPTPTPAAAAPAGTATPSAAAAPSADQARAQQTAAQVQALLAQAETATASRQYDAALSHLDGVLRLEPGHARATSLRATVTQRRDLARRRFVAGRTVVDSEKTRKEKERGGLVGFDADAKTPDFFGRIEFEMSPATGVEANDAWTLKVFVVNQGGKPIRVQGVTLGTTVNGAPAPAPVTPSVREIAPQQRAQVAEASGTWAEGTTAWAAEATLTAPKNETLKSTLTWR